MQLGIEFRSGQARGHTSLWNVTMGPAAFGGGAGAAPPQTTPTRGTRGNYEMGVARRGDWLEGWKEA